jgi:hypothetical protein
MTRFGLIFLLLTLPASSGCDKKEGSKSSSAVEKNTKQAPSPKVQEATKKNALVTKPGGEGTAKAEAKTEPKATANPTPVAVKPVGKVSQTAPSKNIVAPTSVKAFVGLLQSALEATDQCEKREGSIAPKNVNVCLKRVYEIKKASWTPPKEFFPDWNAKKALREALGKVYVESLDHKNLTVVYSALRAGWSSLDNSAETYAKLEKMLDNADKDLAEQAAYARFSRKVKDDGSTLELAQAVLKEHKHERVRLQGCRYVGSKVFAGKRGHFDLLVSYGRDKKESKAVRACAVSQLGVIGSNRDVPKIVKFMTDQDLQYAVVYALGRGLRTKVAYDAYLNFFLKKAPTGKLSSSPFTIFIPSARDREKFDSKKAIKILAIALKAPGELKYWIPSLMGKLGAKKELEAGLKAIGDTSGDWNKETLKKEFTKALTKLAATVPK